MITEKVGFRKFLGVLFLCIFSLGLFYPVFAYKEKKPGEFGVNTATCFNTMEEKSEASLFSSDGFNYFIEVSHRDVTPPNTAPKCLTEPEVEAKEAAYKSGTAQLISQQATAANTQYQKTCGEKEVGIDIAWSLCAVWQDMLNGIKAIFAGFLYLFAKSFDLLVGSVIVRTGEILGKSGEQNIFYQSWSIVRDLANIAGFFGAVFAGVMRIFGTDKEEFKKVLIRVLLFALLTNFSYPITRSVIDFSNILALNIYGGIVDFNLAETFKEDAGVSLRLMKLAGLSTFSEDENNINKDPNNPLNNVTTVTGTFIYIIFMVFLAFIMAKACIFVLGRIITLMLCVILSPLMFLGGLVPFLSGIHDKWRENFINAVAVGPILMISLWLGIQVTEGAGAALTSIGAAAGNNSFATFIQVIFGGMAFYFAIKMTEKFSGDVGQFGAGILSKVSNRVTGGATAFAGGAALGAGKGLWRNTAGRLGNWAATRESIDKTDSNHGVTRRVAAGLIKFAGGGLSKSSGYDDKVQAKAKKIASGKTGEAIQDNDDLRAQWAEAKRTNNVSAMKEIERKADFLKRDSTQEALKGGLFTAEDVVNTKTSKRFTGGLIGVGADNMRDQMYDNAARRLTDDDINRAQELANQDNLAFDQEQAIKLDAARGKTGVSRLIMSAEEKKLLGDNKKVEEARAAKPGERSVEQQKIRDDIAQKLRARRVPKLQSQANASGAGQNANSGASGAPQAQAGTAAGNTGNSANPGANNSTATPPPVNIPPANSTSPGGIII